MASNVCPASPPQPPAQAKTKLGRRAAGSALPASQSNKKKRYGVKKGERTGQSGRPCFPFGGCAEAPVDFLRTVSMDQKQGLVNSHRDCRRRICNSLRSSSLIYPRSAAPRARLDEQRAAFGPSAHPLCRDLLGARAPATNYQAGCIFIYSKASERIDKPIDVCCQKQRHKKFWPFASQTCHYRIELLSLSLSLVSFHRSISLQITARPPARPPCQTPTWPSSRASFARGSPTG